MGNGVADPWGEGGQLVNCGGGGAGFRGGEYVRKADFGGVDFTGDDFNFGDIFIDFECVDGGVGRVVGTRVYGSGFRVGGFVQYCVVDGKFGVGNDDKG